MNPGNVAQEERKIVRVGMVGAGRIAGIHHDVYLRHPAATLVAVTRLNPGKPLFQESTGDLPEAGATDVNALPVYGQLGELLAAEDVEAIDICSPTLFHKEQAIEALQGGKHVLCEKPMARTVGECDAILQAARQSGRKFMVGHCFRFWPAYECLRDIVTSEEYGRVQRARLCRQAMTPAGGWLLDGSMSGGAILDLHVHDVDLASWLFGVPRAVTAFARVGPSGFYDQVTSIWQYTDDRLVQLEVTWITATPIPFTASVEVAMDEATAVCDSAGNPSLRIHLRDREAKAPELDPEDGYFRQIDYFIQAILQDLPIERVPPESSRTNLALIELEIESIESGKTVETSSL